MQLFGKILQTRLSFLIEYLLPNEHYGERNGYFATDAVMGLTCNIFTDVKDTSAITIDIQGAFDNFRRMKFSETMETLGIPSGAWRWTYDFVSERTASKVIDGARGREGKVESGAPQVSPITPFLFLIYKTPVYEFIKCRGAKVSRLIDDITVFLSGNISDKAMKLSFILKGCYEWTSSRSAIDSSNKLGSRHLSNKPCDEPSLLTLPDGLPRSP